MTSLAVKYIEDTARNAKIEAWIETAKRLLAKGLSIEDISELTDLDINTIKNLQKQLKQEQ